MENPQPRPAKKSKQLRLNSSSEFHPVPVNALYHPKHDETSNEEGTPVTEERKRQTRDRSNSDGHADVDEDMHHQQNGNAHGKHGSKAIGCLGRNLQASEDDQKEGS